MSIKAFDEMNGFDGETRAAYRSVKAWLDNTPPDLLEQRRLEAEALFRRFGITFAVYGAKDAEERLIPFDIIPRVLTAKEWSALEQGLVQRVEAINALIVDLYGKREIIRAGILPEELVFSNEAFRPEMIGVNVPGGVPYPSPGSTSCASTRTSSTSSKTTPAHPPASPTCSTTARRRIFCSPIWWPPPGCARSSATPTSFWPRSSPSPRAPPPMIPRSWC